jgi:Na+-translocating ferredoxin:NAD+ oxidoreductase RnfG subunit
MRSRRHGPPKGGHYRHHGPAVAFAVLLAGAVTASAAAITREEALALAFPGAEVRAEQLFLTPAQQKLAAQQAGGEVPSALVARYIATKDGSVVGRAYVDTAVVRTKNETLLISLDAAGRVRRVDVTAFLEPAEYQAPEAWLRQYANRPLADDLTLNKAIRPIAGATLTARAVNAAVRRVLALDAALQTGARE